MKLSTFLLFDRAPDASGCVHARGLETCRLAEELGLDGVWVAEHHFDSFGQLPNPVPFLASAARETARIRLGSAVAVLPWRDPVQTAEDYALVDRLSGGRLELGVGSGARAGELAGFGIDPATKRARLDARLDAVVRLWSGARVELGGPHARVRDVGVNVLPVQRPHPPLHVATSTPEGARAVGRSGHGLLTLLPPEAPTLDALSAIVTSYDAGRTDAGPHRGPRRVSVAAFAHVAASDGAARERAAARFDAFTASHGPASEGAGAWERAMDHGGALFGSPRRVRDRWSALSDLGITELLAWSDFGGLPRESLRDSLRRLREIVPIDTGAVEPELDVPAPEPPSRSG